MDNNKSNTITTFINSSKFAEEMDQNDPMRRFRSKFHLPIKKNGEPYVYLCGNSLGLQPRSTREAIEQELKDWENYGVEGHFHAKNPWMPYHEFLTNAMANLVGAKPVEVVVMNTLSVNLHLMMVSFYQPTKKRSKILIEFDAFPSDKYAVESQIKFHGFDPKECLIELKAREGEELIRMEDIEKVIEEQGAEIALIMIGNTNYYTGQFFDMKKITELGHAKGCKVGFDCAHGAGNVELNLHDSGADFAVWCSYKYINSGPGSLGGCFVHERHSNDNSLPKFAGWWGHNKDTRFGMRDGFDPILGVESWQLSNPPILSMAAILASLKIFEEAGISNLRKKAIQLTSYLEFLVDKINDDRVKIITPRDPKERGSQLSIQVKSADKSLFDKISEKGVIADWREPDVIRIAPVALYNSYMDVFRFAKILKDELI
ncbi:MAG: kynureninase [Saprospiraceae bacterium]|jgi:kynureninase|nr:kynureninase [Saprospiraceae bacterium]MDG1433672.1 kynureninase [Saprospiraceae bacterium]MDG2418752.1 kynureninase [Saprospiraceae bacterium]